MKLQNLVDLLADHADALNAGLEDPFDSEAWLARYAQEVTPGVLSLFRLAQAVKQALVLKPMSAPFRATLRQQLLQESTIKEKRPFLPFGWRGAAVLGSLLSLAGLFILLAHRWRGGQPLDQPAINEL